MFTAGVFLDFFFLVSGVNKSIFDKYVNMENTFSNSVCCFLID